LAVVTAIPIGIVLSRPRFAHAASVSMRCLGVTSTVPVLAILGLLSVLIGIGKIPATVALYVATVMPIVRNTYQGLAGVPAVFLEAAAGIGMSPTQSLIKVELPAATYVIFDGIRIAMVINVGTAPLAFLIGGGGLGDLIFTGIALNDTASMLAGAIPVAALAISIDALLANLSNIMTSVGAKHHYQQA
jgi:osmoprotectant transport system permease protein